VKKKMRLGMFIYPGGHHFAGWRHKTTPASRLSSLDFYVNVARLAERGKFDLLFIGDQLNVREKNGRFFGRQTSSNLDPISLLSALSGVTNNIGLVATLSTTYNEPYTIANKFATLDHLSNGRAGWNIVTTMDDKAALNFSRSAAMEKTDRYIRGREFVDVCTSLWDSWGDDALKRDGGKSQFCDTSLIAPIRHWGGSFNVEGPLRLPRPVQGWPVLVQAGGSPQGIEFAALVAEVIFTAQTDIDPARTFRKTIQEKLARYGRRPEDLAIMPGLSPLIGSTEAEVFRLEEELSDLLHPELAMWTVSHLFQFPLDQYGPDDKLPYEEIRKAKKMQSAAEAVLSNSQRQQLTIAQTAREVARSRTHGNFAGTPDQFVAHVENWMSEGACDGFNIMPPYFPSQLEVFVDQVVPLLQKKHLLREEYDGRTLRDNLGFARPARNHFKKLLSKGGVSEAVEGRAGAA
jgi:FMN-dependent oxidoreductase (nitrilotriacetate monooxygenase family)